MIGDKLASGAKSASFTSNDGTVSQEKWDEAFKDFDQLHFLNKDLKPASEPDTLEMPDSEVANG